MAAAKLNCPHCGVPIELRKLDHPGLFANYRLCPDCKEAFTVDDKTRRRQMICIGIALLSLAFTVLLYFGENDWLLPALVSYALLAMLIYYGNRRVKLVPRDRN